jgi:FAD/FMN-containing dehydrogenase
VSIAAIEFRPTRRTILGVAAGSGLGLALAACTSSGSNPNPSSSAPPASSPPGSSPSSAPVQTTTRSPLPPSSASVANYGTLSSQLDGHLIRPGQDGFTSAAQLYNPRFDDAPAPAAVAACTSEKDVVDCVRFTAAAGVPLALRAGGHSYGGWSRNHGLVADVRAMSSVQVDSAAKLARIGAGARLVEVYSALGAAGVAVAGGSCPTVGITGLALGGGQGVLSRAFGLTCDAIRSARVVTADGRARTVDATHDPDLFWALRGGGGGSFGAVTSLTMAVRPAPTVHVFFLAFDFSHAADVLSAWLRWVPDRPAALWTTCKLLANAQTGRLRAVVAGTWIGAAADLDGQLAPLLRGLPAPTSRSTSTKSYTAAMFFEAGCDQNGAASSCISQALAPAQRHAFAATSSVVGSALPSAGIDAAVKATRAAMNLSHLIEAGVSFDALGGQVAQVAASATAFPYRRALATVQYTATWASGRTSPDPFDRYVRGFRSTMSRWLGAAAYANYADASITDYGTAYWGANYPRLQQVKQKYDPHQLFTFAQAVRPA